MNEWWSKYIGTPFADNGRDFKGVDCAGLVMLAHKVELGKDIDDFNGRYSAKVIRQASAGIAAVREASFARVDGPRPFAVALFARGGMAYHVGLCIDDERVLHAKAGEHVKCQGLRDMADYPWLEGFYAAK